MILVKSPTELTTSATDLFLAIECAFILILLWKTPAVDRWRTFLWCWFFGLLAFSSFLGAAAHGLDLQASKREALFVFIFFGLGVVVVLLAAGALLDWCGRDTMKRPVWLFVTVSIVLFSSGRFLRGALILFAIYKALALMVALAIYSSLAATHKLKGSPFISLAILLTLVAVGVQTRQISITIFFPFDHNGIFHLIEIAALAVLGFGLKIGMKPY